MDSHTIKYSTPSAGYAIKPYDAALKDFGNVDITTGLSDSDAIRRRATWGANEFSKKETEPLWVKFLDGFKDPLILLLFGAAFVSLLMGQIEDGISIACAILIVVTVGFVQEYRTEKSLEALNKLVPHNCRVFRNGHVEVRSAADLVPGDIVKLHVGDRVPADLRLCESVDLEIDESNLTGETKPCRKQTDEIDPHAPAMPISSMEHKLEETLGRMDTIADHHISLPVTPRGFNGEVPITGRNNIAYMGTLVRAGHGTGVVVAIGEQTEFGHVFKMMREEETPRTTLQKRMDELGQKLSTVSIGITVTILLIGVIQGRGWLEMFTVGVSLAVAAIPEGLPIVVAVTLALGVMRMAGKNAIVKKLPSVESLGSITVLCADKTGTLTENVMTVTHVYTRAGGITPVPRTLKEKTLKDTEDPDGISELCKISSLCNNAQFENGQGIGQATEVALLNMIRVFDYTDLRSSWTRVQEIAFSSENKIMTVTARPPGSKTEVTFVKGATEIVLTKCHGLSEDAKLEIHREANKCASKGLRVLSMATSTDREKFKYAGFVAMADPPRKGVEHAIAGLHGCGVRVAMITGDSRSTAIAIAHQIGIKVEESEALSGPEIDVMQTHGTLAHGIRHVTVFYRTAPAHKLAIVKALQENGEVVAMTGDGVNDGPALRASDIGVSMGMSATDVAKEAADMILVDDNLGTIIYAIEEGRSVYRNIQNFLRYQLSISAAALGLIAMSTLLGFHNPMNATQILWINLIMDGAPAQSLGVEPADPDVLSLPPRKKNTQILTKDLLIKVALAATTIFSSTMWIHLLAQADIIPPSSGLTTRNVNDTPALVPSLHDSNTTILAVQAPEEEPHYLGNPDSRDVTMTFTTFVLSSLFFSFACRSENKSIFRIGLFSNRPLCWSLSLCVLGQLMVVYIPLLQSVFQTAPLSLGDLSFIVAVSSIILWVEEIRKWFFVEKLRAESVKSEKDSFAEKDLDIPLLNRDEMV